MSSITIRAAFVGVKRRLPTLNYNRGHNFKMKRVGEFSRLFFSSLNIIRFCKKIPEYEF